jgi:hypothetical protein
MRVPIRMIGIATTIFWVFLLVFAISAVYSVKDLQFSLGDPQMSLTADNEMILSLPITIANKGFYNVGFFKITTEISDAEGFTITRNSTVIPLIRRGEEVVATHVMTVNLSDFLQSGQNYLLNDTELKMGATLSMRIAEVIPVQASTNLFVPWGAPFYNFSLGAPEYTAFNSTHLRITVPISFGNHAFFDVAGAIQVRMYNNTNSLASEAQTAIAVSEHSSYNGYVEFYVPISEMTNNGRFEVYFATPLFNYGPLVIPYG